MTRRRVFMALASCVLCACGSQNPGPGHVCTALFASITSTVVDSTGKPVTDLAIRDSVLRSGHAFDIDNQSLAVLSPGIYAILTDNDRDSVRMSGDSVRVTGNSAGPPPSPGFSVTYVFGSDGCHVRKLAGPDTVVAR